MSSQRLYGNDSDFWTSDDEEGSEGSSETERRSKNESSSSSEEETEKDEKRSKGVSIISNDNEGLRFPIHLPSEQNAPFSTLAPPPAAFDFAESFPSPAASVLLDTSTLLFPQIAAKQKGEVKETIDNKTKDKIAEEEEDKDAKREHGGTYSEEVERRERKNDEYNKGQEVTQALSPRSQSSPSHSPSKVSTEKAKKKVEVSYDDVKMAVPPPSSSSSVGASLMPKKKYIRKKWVIEDETDMVDFYEKVPNMAMKFPFELDVFQKRAVVHLHKREHVFVAAHTSAGKTVVAEYAMSLAIQRGKKAVYTSPIKALSNQKYREFKQKFDSVGIVTGDVSVNPDASCLIVTTEILRTLLYRGDPLIGTLDVVIFDEVHYVNDPERGVVWEECIIMMPHTVNLVMLSATVPNYREFADWIGFTKQREVFTIHTLFRPTPLKHFLFIADKAFLLMDARCSLNANAYNEMYKYIREKTKATASTSSSSSGSQQSSNKNKANQSQQQKKPIVKPQTAHAREKTEVQRLQGLIKKLEGDGELPVVAFCFSRRKCESYANCMPKLDVTASQQDKSKIHIFIKESLSSLTDNDAELPQVRNVVALLTRGIGIHHGGLLPLLKELVEILFSRGLVRVLFATETFAMGVNMPAKSVVFTSLKKHDGQKFRILHASEYTQMAGRAGRRGLDKFGNVYIFCSDEPPDQKELTTMMVEKATPLQSKFRLTYQMMLQFACRSHSLLRIEDMMARSFKEYMRAQALPTIKRDLARRKKELELIPEVHCIFGEPAIDEYSKSQSQYTGLAVELHSKLWDMKGDSIYSAGRTLILHSIPHVRSACIAVLLGVHSRPRLPTDSPTFTCLVLLPPGLPKDDLNQEAPNDRGHFSAVCRGSIGGIVEASVGLDTRHLPTDYVIYRGVPLDNIMVLCDEVLKGRAEHLDMEDKAEVNALAQELQRLWQNSDRSNNLKPFVFTKQFKQIEIQFFETILKQKDIHKKMRENKCHKCFKKEENLDLVYKKQKCIEDIEDFSHRLRDESLDLYGEMKAKIEVLKALKFVEPNGRPTLKGQVACDILTNDELSLAEIIFQNVLHDLEPEEVAAILSAYIFAEKNDDEVPDPTAAIQTAKITITEIHANILKLQKTMRVPVDTTEYWRLCNFQLSLVAYKWARGMTFGEIMEVTSVQEGSIVRAILRLFELCKKISDVAVRIGDSRLALKMAMTCSKIRRDIVFAMSLYLQ